MKGQEGEEAMVEIRKNGTDAEMFADTRAERRANAYAEFRAIPRADEYAELCAVARAVLRADAGAETGVDYGRNMS